MVLLKRRNIFELCAMKQWKRWLATVRGAKRMRAGGSPLLGPDGFPRMVTMPLTQLFSLKYFS